jgi:Flp pilus assembly protein TadD
MNDLEPLLLGRRIQLALVVAFGLLAYANTFGAPFTFDDERCIVANPVIRSFDFFADPSLAAGIPGSTSCAFQTRWVGHLTFAVNYRLGGLHPGGYHAVNLAVHVGTALLAWLLVTLLLRAPFLAERPPPERTRALLPLFAALLFVVHPLQTQAVTYVTQRFASLATLLYLLAVVLYVAFRLAIRPAARILALAGGLAAALLAMWTKEIAFTLPFAIALVEVLFWRGSWRPRLLVLAPFLATALVIPWRVGLLSASSLSEADAGLQAAGGSVLSRAEYVATQLRVVVSYLRLFVLPIGQNVDPDVQAYRSFLDGPVILSAAALLALLAAGLLLLLRSARTRAGAALGLAGFGILWFLGTLTVESGAIPLSDLLVEHRMYLPSVGLAIAVSALAFGVRDRLQISRPTWAAAVVPALCATVLVLGVATFARNHVWGDEIRLWEDAAHKGPSKVRPRMELGALYSAQGRFDDALRELQTVLRLQPSYPEAYNSLGVILRRQGRLDEAMSSYLAALALRPDFAEARHNLALALVAQGRIEEATAELEEAVRAKPEYAEAHNALGVLYAQQGRIEDALREWQATLRVNPAHAKARANLERARGGM